MPYTYPAAYPYYQQQQNTGLIWIQGEAAAKSYLVAPNSSVALFDSEAQTVYIKSADASGMPSLKILDYTIRNAQNAPQIAAAADKPEYATKDEIAAMSEEIKTMRAKLEKLEVLL